VTKPKTKVNLIKQNRTRLILHDRKTGMVCVAGNYLAALLTVVSLLGSTVLAPISSVVGAVFMLSAVTSGSAFAQAGTPLTEPGSDVNPPVIELEAIPQGIAGQDQVFTALVADNGNLQDVKLYYRFSNQQAYQSLLMESLGRTDYYIATVTTSADETRSIEYYVQARDVAGNRIVEGFAYEPLVRQLLAPDTSNAPTQTTAPQVAAEEPAAESGGGLKVWQIVLGVVAVGALAGLAASSGGDGGGSGGQTVPLTITIDAP